MYKLQVAELKAQLQQRTRDLEELRRVLGAWKTGQMADHTGHMFRCAKVNGTWSCAKGCAEQRYTALLAKIRGLRKYSFRTPEPQDFVKWTDLQQAIREKP